MSTRPIQRPITLSTPTPPIMCRLTRTLPIVALTPDVGFAGKLGAAAALPERTNLSSLKEVPLLGKEGGAGGVSARLGRLVSPASAERGRAQSASKARTGLSIGVAKIQDQSVGA